MFNMSLVCKRFHQLVTTPHAWRSAFARFFPGAESLADLDSTSDPSTDGDMIHSARRCFTRLNPPASWRTEYILRTQLLRALTRGKPSAKAIPRSTNSKTTGGHAAHAQVTYNSNLASPVTKLHANFSSHVSKHNLRFIHGADEVGMASRSEPLQERVDNWGFQDSLAFRQFADLHPLEDLYGLGSGDVVGVPNSMDVSQLFGMLYGEGHAHDSVLWFRHADEKRGRALLRATSLQEPENGIPHVSANDAVSSVWIAKSTTLPELSAGLIGMMAGSAAGILTMYSTGTNGVGNARYERGQITCRWVLSPGVPIIAIAVDEQVSSQRLRAGRVWVMALNALGEVYYLDSLPSSMEIVQSPRPSHNSLRAQQHLERSAWVTGRTVCWKLVEATKRLSRTSGLEDDQVDGSYPPRSSCLQTHPSQAQLTVETHEIEDYMRKKPNDFRKAFDGWDMCRRFEVDFAATNKDDAGETFVIISCGVVESQPVSIRGFTRCKFLAPHPATMEQAVPLAKDGRRTSRQRGTAYSSEEIHSWSFAEAGFESQDPKPCPSTQHGAQCADLWQTTDYAFARPRPSQITSSTLDISICATMTIPEFRAVSSDEPSLVPHMGTSSKPCKPIESHTTRDTPGEWARLMAVGIKGGTVFIYDVRASSRSSAENRHTVGPLRIIDTGSPQISCLAISALYLVHGGNDGLVQAWDPLASTIEPLRTLNSRFSSRARRRLVQAEASAAGVGINMFAAGAIVLHPDPTVLCGMVSLGAHLRFWNYSSDDADQFKGNKRRLRRSERGSNQGPDHFSGTGRGVLRDYIANERLELEREKRARRKEQERMIGRFGVNLLGPGASEDEILAYAALLSEEAAQDDELRRQIANSSNTNPPSPVASSPGVDADVGLSQALQQSLREPDTNPDEGSSLPLNLTKAEGSFGEPFTDSIALKDDEDLEFALQLSLAEEDSRFELAKGKQKEA